MAILNFTLSPEALGKLHDALVCLGKFSESVSFEAAPEKLVLTALNSSKSAYASFTLTGHKFFTKYQYKPVRPRDKFHCRIYNKALLSVFKGRVGDPLRERERETAIERCDVSVEDGEGKSKSRFVVKIICRHGVIKTYRLTFESIAPMHAHFDPKVAHNRWAITSRTLREFVEHFGPGTEQLDIYSEDGRVSLTSYTEKIMSGNEILKQPLHTTIAVDTLEFAEFAVEEQLHIIISVKDFKSIITHAGITNVLVKAQYSHPNCPMELAYSDEGIQAQFILMTIGEVRGSSATPAPNSARAGTKRPASRQPLEATPGSKRASSSEMPPPIRPGPSRASQLEKNRLTRPSPPPPQPSIQSDALFLPPGDDDKAWDPLNYEDDEEMLLYDSGTVDNNPMTMNSGRNISGPEAKTRNGRGDGQQDMTRRLPPTQSMGKGLFDD